MGFESKALEVLEDKEEARYHAKQPSRKSKVDFEGVLRVPSSDRLRVNNRGLSKLRFGLSVRYEEVGSEPLDRLEAVMEDMVSNARLRTLERAAFIVIVEGDGGGGRMSRRRWLVQVGLGCGTWLVAVNP